MKTSLILQKVSFLHGLIDPSWIDGNPGQPGPIFGTAITDLVVAELLRDISVNLHDRDLATKVHNIGKELVSSSSQGLTAGWEDGDDICPPWFKGGPRPHTDGVSLTSPHPEPWLEHVTPAMNDIVLAHALRELASLTSSEKSSNGIRQVGESIVKAASSKLFDEYCGTPVKIHVPVPKPKTTVAA
ncbi:MAG: hypothetical protein ACXV8M_05185 [Candidatus Angelobacter sp.]